MYRVAERFISINGEGRKAGELAVFIRFVGCNLNCTYCDTAWAIPSDATHELMNRDDIIQYVKETGIRNVTLTGGEPLLQEGIEELVSGLLDEGYEIEIETNGAVDITPMIKATQSSRKTDYQSDGVADYIESESDRLTITLDYKCPGSGMEEHMLMDNYEVLRPWDVVKFVVSDAVDLDRAREVIERYDLTNRCKAYLSAVFDRITPAEIVEYMKEHRMNGVVHQLQQHKYIWDPNKRGV